MPGKLIKLLAQFSELRVAQARMERGAGGVSHSGSQHGGLVERWGRADARTARASKSRREGAAKHSDQVAKCVAWAPRARVHQLAARTVSSPPSRGSCGGVLRRSMPAHATTPSPSASPPSPALARPSLPRPPPALTRNRRPNPWHNSRRRSHRMCYCTRARLRR